MNDAQIIEVIKLIADGLFDGHFTVMKFTTNWRVSFDSQPDSRIEIQRMGSGRTLFDAFVNALELINRREGG